MGPCWVQIGSSRPSFTNLEAILRPLGAYTTQDAKNDSKFIEISKKSIKFDTYKAPEEQLSFENVGREANSEKTTMKLKHIDLETIWRPFWRHLGVLGRPLGSILGVLGLTQSNVEPFWSRLEAT